MNSDWETARRFALRRFPAGYAERSALKKSKRAAGLFTVETAFKISNSKFKY